MPAAAPIPRRPQDEPFAKRQRFQIIKIAVAGVFVLLLMSAGFQGRQHARLQVKLNEITAVRDQLRRRLNDLQTNSPGLPTSSNLQAESLVNALKARLDQFDFDHRPRALSEAEHLELRLSQATLANAEGRFADALTLLTEQDEKTARSELRKGRLAPLLQVRGDSFYGLRQWQNALDRYREVLTLKPNHRATLARVAQCQRALGGAN
jgi:hypothetical protein